MLLIYQKYIVVSIKGTKKDNFDKSAVLGHQLRKNNE